MAEERTAKKVYEVRSEKTKQKKNNKENKLLYPGEADVQVNKTGRVRIQVNLESLMEF